MPTPLRSRLASLPTGSLCVAALGALLAPRASAQVPTEVKFSVDWQGPSMGVPNGGQGAPITEADLLIKSSGVFNSVPPSIRISGMFLQRYSQCSGHLPGVSCGVEIDALSFGIDARIRSMPGYTFDLLFSVDEHAQGGQSMFSPNVATEAAVGDAAADVFMRRFNTAGPYGPAPGWNLAVVDGDGERSASGARYPGQGLIEPTAPTPTVPELGDNLDALDIGPAPAAGGRIFFSLEGGLGDPFEPGVAITNSAALQPDPTGAGFTGADVLVVDNIGLVLRYASADQLGLSSLGLDDIDALIVFENGVPGYQPSLVPYDWSPNMGSLAKDLVLFSVRRGSAVIGQLDTQFGIPITEGDLLGPPAFGGLLGPNPAIFVAAENLGLRTMRGQLMTAGDELDAVDMRDNSEDPIKDCNDNGIEDAYDIAIGSSMDVDANGVPDECEDPGDVLCDCDTAAESICGNTAGTGEGCRNSLGMGGKMIATGTSSIASDSLAFSASQLIPNTFALTLMGAGTVNTPLPNCEGRLCISGPGGTGLFRTSVQATGTMGGFTYGPGILTQVSMLVPAPSVLAGATWGFQTWYRESGGPCGQISNLTNAWSTTFTP